MSDALNAWYSDSNHVLAAYKNVHIQIWRGSHTLHSFNMEAPPMISNILARHPTGHMGLVIVTPEAAIPDAFGRRAAAAVWKSFEATTAGLAVVILGDGLRGPLVRAVVTGITILVSTTRGMRSFSSVSEATQWLASIDPERSLDSRALDRQLSMMGVSMEAYKAA